MKLRRFAVAVAALVMMAGTAFSGLAQETKLDRKMQMYGVAFYNLENLFDTINNNGKYDKEFTPDGGNKWDSHKYWSKIKNMSYAISQMTNKYTPNGPAVIGVCEVENRSVLEDLVKADAIKDWNLQIVHHDSPDRRGVDVSLLYNPKQFRVLKVDNYKLEIPDKPNFLTRDQMCVVGLLGGSRVAIIVNHWPSRRGGEEQSSYLREAAAQLCRNIADSLYKVDPNIGVIIMGDLNDNPFNKSCAKILDAKKKAKDVKPGGYFNPFYQKIDDGVGSYIYRSDWSLFDQIIINYNLLEGKCGGGLKYYGAEVLNKEFLKQRDGQYQGYTLRTFSGGAWLNGYSDHFPTEIFLVKEVKH